MKLHALISLARSQCLALRGKLSRLDKAQIDLLAVVIVVICVAVFTYAVTGCTLGIESLRPDH